MKKFILPFLCIISIAFFSYQFFVAKPVRNVPSLKWQPQPQTILAQFEGAHDPQLFLDTQGKFCVLAVGRNPHGSQLQLFTSTDNGNTFSTGVPISEKNVQLDSHGENAPIIVQNKRGPVVLWGQKNASNGSDIVCARSIDGGKSFSKAVRVNDGNPQSSAYLGHLAAGPKVLLASWLDGRDNAHDGTTSLYFARSNDGGKTWQKNVRIAQSVCPCCRPDVVALPDGKIVVAWRKVFPGEIRDMVCAVSDDDGKSWSAPRRIAVDNWHIMGCPETGPRLAVIGKRLFAAWYSKGTGKNPGIRFSWSDDDGATWREPAIVSTFLQYAKPPQSKYLQDAGQPHLFADQQNVYLTFRADEPQAGDTKSTFKTYVMVVQKDGNFSLRDQVPGNYSTGFPTLISNGKGDLTVAWNGANTLQLSRAKLINR